MFKLGDEVVYEKGCGLDEVFKVDKITKKGKPIMLSLNGLGGYPCRYLPIRHATTEEVKAGKRL